MHTATTTKILHALKDLFVTANRRDDAMMLQLIAAECEFDLSLRDEAAKSRHAGVKRVAFVLDYSGNNALFDFLNS